MTSWMGQTGTYAGPSLAERAAKREAAKLAFHVRTSKTTDKQQLRQAFEDAGADVLDVRIVFRDAQSTGVGYVDVRDAASIERGLALDGTTLNGETLKVRRNMDKRSLKKLVAGWQGKEASGPGGAAASSSSSAPATYKRGTCFAFQRGQCQRGDRCKFAHEAAAGVPVSAASADGGSRRVASPSSSAREAQKVCFDFLRGKCKWGDKCRFAHVNTKEAREHGSSAASLEAYASSTTVCRDFQKGSCKRGESCRFVHSHDASATGTRGKKVKAASPVARLPVVADGATTGPEGQQLCRDFQKGKCRRATCRFWPCQGGRASAAAASSAAARAESDPSGPGGEGAGDKRARPKGAAYGQKPPPADFQVKKKQKIKNQNQKIHRAKSLTPEVQAVVDRLLKSRQAARDQKDWKEADRIRNELKAKGVVVTDSKAGPVVKVL